VVKEKGKFAVLLLFIVALVGSLAFLKWALIGRNLPRESFSEPMVKVLSYSTFVSSTGPAPQLVRAFKERCKCKVEFYTAGDAGLLLERLKLTQDKASYDVVLGFDQFAASKAVSEWTWLDVSLPEEVQQNWAKGLPKDSMNPLVAFDYAPMTFIYRKDEVTSPPTTLKDLLKPDYAKSLSLQDPRSSSPGLQFLSWVEQTQDGLSYLKSLKKNIHSVSPSWALSYGLFKKKQSKFVFSYLTSLAFHYEIEGDSNFGALIIEEGHPVQIEYAGVPKGCKNCEIGKDFVRFLLEKESQSLIAEKNFMYPVLGSAPLPKGFERLPELKYLPFVKTPPFFEVWDRAFE